MAPTPATREEVGGAEEEGRVLDDMECGEIEVWKRDDGGGWDEDGMEGLVNREGDEDDGMFACWC